MQPEDGIFSSECDGTFLYGKGRKVGWSSEELLLLSQQEGIWYKEDLQVCGEIPPFSDGK